MKKYPCPNCGNPLTRNGKGPLGTGQRWVCFSGGSCRTGTYCYSTTDPTAPARSQDGKSKARKGKAPIFKRDLSGSSVFIVTTAQNATPVDKPFLAALEACANHRSAELIVIPTRYKNPTSRWSMSQANAEIWDPAIAAYRYNQRKRLCPNLTLLADIKVQPTASDPLTGFDAITGGESGILGHTKLQLRTIATPASKFPKLLTTTGACTVKNYTDSKAGKLGEFHHTLAAAIVEVKGKKFHLRQLNAAGDGSFYDLETLYSDKAHPRQGSSVAALVMGDTHVDSIDPGVEAATFGPDGMIVKLLPKVLVWHDLVDSYSINHHHRGNPFNAIAKRQSGLDDARKEMMRAIEFVKKHTPAYAESIVVPSNHNDFLQRWIVNADWRLDPVNAEFYLETALAMVRGTKIDSAGTTYPDPLSYWVKRMELERIRCLDNDESYRVRGIELSMHGDRGPNGARGSIRNLRRIGVKSIIGHTHSPGIDEGAYQTGTSTRLRLEYNTGPSSWLNTHALVYDNGKRTLINIIDGEWRL